PVSHGLASDSYEVGNVAAWHSITETISQAITITCVRRVDRCRTCRTRPWICSLLIPTCCRVVPFCLCWQISTIPYAQGHCFVPHNAIHWPPLIGSGCVGPRFKHWITLHVRDQCRRIRRKVRVPTCIPTASLRIRVCTRSSGRRP